MTQKPSSIFGRGDEPYGNATLGPVPNPWGLYAYGFSRAAAILLEHVETRHVSLDVIVFPVVFLYRHQLELAIKLIDHDARLLLGQSPRAKPEHRLRVLWDDTKKLITGLDGVEPAGLESVDAAVSQFHEIDPTSTAFRYPSALDGTPNLSSVANINLLTLRDSLQPVFEMLDAAHEVLRIQLEGP